VISIYKPVQIHVIFIFAAHFKNYILISESVICMDVITSLFSPNLCIPHVPLNMANISTMPNEESFSLFSAYYDVLDVSTVAADTLLVVGSQIVCRRA